MTKQIYNRSELFNLLVNQILLGLLNIKNVKHYISKAVQQFITDC